MMGFNYLDVKPAYGWDYKCKADVLKDWNANKDFQMLDGAYINKADWIKYKDASGYDYIKFWYNKNTTVIVEKGE